MNRTLVLLLLFVACVCGQHVSPGHCPTPEAHDDFDPSKIYGTWIETEKTASVFDPVLRCQETDFTDDGNSSVAVVVRGQTLANIPISINGIVRRQHSAVKGLYNVRYGFGVPFQGTLSTIVATDYKQYTVVYSCTNSLITGAFHTEYVSVLTRDGKLSNPNRQIIYERLDVLKINRAGLQVTDRRDCLITYGAEAAGIEAEAEKVKVAKAAKLAKLARVA